MAITLWRQTRPFEGISRWMEDLDRWFDFDIPELQETRWTPAIDIEEKEGKYLVKADLPGLKKEDIHIELHDGLLTLRGERKTEHEEKKKGYHRVERFHGSFERTIRVPEGVTEKDIQAKYKDGVLELTIPTPKEEKPKAIEVKVE